MRKTPIISYEAYTGTCKWYGLEPISRSEFEKWETTQRNIGRTSLHQGTKADVVKRCAKELIEQHSNECQQMISAGINPYSAVVAMDSKIQRIATGNHPGVFKYDE